MEPTKNPAPNKSVVLACLDLSEATHQVLGYAFAMSERPDRELHIVVVGSSHQDKLRLDLGDKLGDFSAKAAAAYVQVRLANDAKRLVGEGNEDRYVGTRVHVVAGDPVEEIVKLAVRLNADVILVGTHGRRGARRLVLGSVAEGVVRTAGCPVVVTREKDHDAVHVAEEGRSDFPLDLML